MLDEGEGMTRRGSGPRATPVAALVALVVSWGAAAAAGFLPAGTKPEGVPSALPAQAYPEAPDLKFYAVSAGQAVQALHRGSHDTIRQTIDKVEAFIAEKGLTRKGPLVEYHFNHKPPEEEHLQLSVVTVYVE